MGEIPLKPLYKRGTEEDLILMRFSELFKEQ